MVEFIHINNLGPRQNLIEKKNIDYVQETLNECTKRIYSTNSKQQQLHQQLITNRRYPSDERTTETH